MTDAQKLQAIASLVQEYQKSDKTCHRVMAKKLEKILKASK